MRIFRCIVWAAFMGIAVFNCLVNFGAPSVVLLVLFSMIYVGSDVFSILRSNRKLLLLLKDVLKAKVEEDTH